MKQYLLVLLLIPLFTCTRAQRFFTVTDARDSQVYNAVEFTIPLAGGVSIKRSWMLDNANYQTQSGSACYREEPAYCEKFGRLYTYEAALEACPEGWRIPTRSDWVTLFSIFQGTHKAGGLLVSDSVGINILYAGFRYEGGNFNHIALEGNYWDSSDEGVAPEGIINFAKGRESVAFSQPGTKYMNSCRCIKIH